MAKNEKNQVIEKEEEVAVVVVEPVVELVEFETWFSVRASKIPACHHREIIKADFNARKVPVMASMVDFDAALKMYGVVLG